MLTEVVVAGDGLPAEVAHEAPAPARHPVAALRLDQACAALDTLPHTSCCHAFLTETQEQCFFFFLLHALPPLYLQAFFKLKVTQEIVCAAQLHVAAVVLEATNTGILSQGPTRCLLYEGPENKSARPTSPQRSRPHVVTEALLSYANRIN